jgi:hypothetical protein
MASHLLDGLVKKLDKVCEDYRQRKMSDLAFQKEAAELAAEWAAQEITGFRLEGLVGRVPLHEITVVAQVLVDVIESKDGPKFL